MGRHEPRMNCVCQHSMWKHHAGGMQAREPVCGPSQSATLISVASCGVLLHERDGESDLEGLFHRSAGRAGVSVSRLVVDLQMLVP